MARAKLPKEIIKKYGISKKAWAVFRGRNAGKKVRKVKCSEFATALIENL